MQGGGAAGCVRHRRRRAASSFPAPPVSHGDVSPAQPAAISGSAESLVQLARWPRRTELGGPQGWLPPLRRERGGVRMAAALGRTEVGASPRPCRGCRSSSHLSSPLPWAVGLNFLIYLFFSFPPPPSHPLLPGGSHPTWAAECWRHPAPRHGSRELVAMWGHCPPPGQCPGTAQGQGAAVWGGLGGVWALPSAVVGFGSWHQPQIPPPGAAPVLPACCRGPVPYFC